MLSLALYALSLVPAIVLPKGHRDQLFVNSLGMKFVKVPSGSFRMGPSGPAAVEYVRLFGSPHNVVISSFWMSCYLTTNKQYDAFRLHRRSSFSLGDDTPVDNLTHKEAADFARWLSRREHRRYALPTEAQWEYAARGGLAGKSYPWGDEEPEGKALIYSAKTVKVGSFAANGYGLYDMAGNAMEWIREADYTYGTKTQKDPVGPLTGAFYLTRGGGLTWELKVFERFPAPAQSPAAGVRLVCLDFEKDIAD